MNVCDSKTEFKLEPVTGCGYKILTDKLQIGVALWDVGNSVWTIATCDNWLFDPAFIARVFAELSE